MDTSRKKKFSQHTEETLTREAGDGTIKKALANTSAGKRAFGSKAPSTDFGTGAKMKR